MKITVALDSFKGSCSAKEACEAVAMGIKNYIPDANTILCPVSDGGEGLIDTLYPILKSMGYEKYSKEVTGPYLKKVVAHYLKKDNYCILEMAQCSGLELEVKEKRNCLDATTYGLGELLDYVISKGCTDIKVGLGGSATNDAGIGFAQALGAKFYTKDGCEIKHILCAKDIQSVARVDTEALDKKLKGINVYGTCDVNNTLIGKNGATYVFGPQKGLDLNLLDKIDNDIKYLASMLDKHYMLDVVNTKGSGAAGGLGAALIWYCKGELKPGIDVVMEILSLEDHIKDSSLVIVGEGRMDGQSVQGKAPLGVASVAKKYSVPVVSICGSIASDAKVLYKNNIDAMFSICDGPMPLEKAMANAKALLEKTSENVIRLIGQSQRIKL